MKTAVEFTQKRYRCPSCRRSWASASRAGQHIADCHKDPDVRACSTCVHEHMDSHDGPTCELGARPEWMQIKRHCEQWSAR